jgi:type III restriction enzyme
MISPSSIGWTLIDRRCPSLLRRIKSEARLRCFIEPGGLRRMTTKFASPAVLRCSSRNALDVIRRYERKLGDVRALRNKEVQQQIAAEVRELLQPMQATLPGIVEGPRVEKIVNVVATAWPKDPRLPPVGHSGEARTYLAKAVDDPRESRMEDYLVRYLIERNEIDYDAHADLLYKLAGQVVGLVAPISSATSSATS